MTISYTTGIPDANHNPSVDQPKMQVNNDNIKQIIGVDHCTFDPTSLAQISGQHLHVTFPEGQSDPALTQVQTQLYPKLFGTGTQLLETYTAGRMSNSAQINGYLPFVKCMGRFTGIVAPFGPITPPAGPPFNVLYINIASIVQSTTNVSRPGDTVTVNFTTALANTNYFVFLEYNTITSGIVVTKNLTSIVFQVVGPGATFTSQTLGFMVI